MRELVLVRELELVQERELAPVQARELVLAPGLGPEQVPHRQVGSQLITVPAELTIFSFSLIYLLLRFCNLAV